MPILKEWLRFNRENMVSVPEVDGVFELGDEEGKIIYIAGTPNLRHSLEDKLNSDNPILRKAKFFRYQESFMYTLRESELIQQFIRQYHRLPEGNEEIV